MLILGILLLCLGGAELYWASELWKFQAKGIRGKATVLKIEVIESYDSESDTIRYTYWLHIKLPPYKGVPLGTKLTTLKPSLYTVGEEVSILINEHAPTDVLVEKELTPNESPMSSLIVGLVLILLSYVSCHI